MKRIIVMAMLLFVALSLALAQNKRNGNLEQALMQMDRDWNSAHVKNDAATLNRIAADSFMFVAPNGTVQNKSSYVSDITSGRLKFTALDSDEMNTRIYGNTAILMGRAKVGGRFQDSNVNEDISGQYRFTDVYAKQQGRWRLISSQVTRIAQQQ